MLVPDPSSRQVLSVHEKQRESGTTDANNTAETTRLVQQEEACQAP